MRSRRGLGIVLLLLLLLALLLWWRGCSFVSPPAGSGDAAPDVHAAEGSGGEAGGGELPPEVLGAATLRVPERVDAGAELAVEWTGPANASDFVTIVPAGAPDSASGAYEIVGDEPTLTLVAPIDPGPCEVRYVTARSRAVLAHAPIEVVVAAATLDAPAEVVMGSRVTVSWTGPDNPGDYVTIVAKDAPDGRYESYTTTDRGSPLEVAAPTAAGVGEVRYMTGQGGRVLARRDVRIVQPEVSLDAPAEAIAGATIDVEWTGPANAGDYITVVAKGTPDGQYGSYVDTANGSPARLLLPILAGEAELTGATATTR